VEFSDVLGRGGRREPGEYGEWDDVVRAVAEHRADRFDRLLTWRLRDLLLAYRWRVREDALAHWRHDVLVWATGRFDGPMPDPPRSLQPAEPVDVDGLGELLATQRAFTEGRSIRGDA